MIVESNLYADPKNPRPRLAISANQADPSDRAWARLFSGFDDPGNKYDDTVKPEFLE